MIRGILSTCVVTLAALALAGCEQADEGSKTQGTAASIGEFTVPLHLAYNPNAGKGERVFEQKCLACHAEDASPLYPGSFALARTRGEEYAYITSRDDLTEEYVSLVVRTGLGSMPGFGPTEISDAELAALAAYVAEPQE